MDTLAKVPDIASEGVLNFLNITAIYGEMEDPDMERKEDSDDVGRYFMRTKYIIATSNHVDNFRITPDMD
jgi:hypothetical protein